MARPRGQKTPTPKWETATLILDEGQPLARLEGALWPPVGVLVQHPDKNLIARVASVDLSFRREPSTALIVINLESESI